MNNEGFTVIYAFLYGGDVNHPDHSIVRARILGARIELPIAPRHLPSGELPGGYPDDINTDIF